MSTPHLEIIIGSTRPGRVGPAIARWFADAAVADGRFDVELIDLAEVNLPLLDEPNHPIQGRYEHEHTRRWSATIQAADALVFVVPEYNHSFNAATKNAIDYLYHEWRYKPVGIISYGGPIMGTRAAQHLKTVFSALRMVHAGDVSISLVPTPVTDGAFSGTDAVQRATATLLDELAKLGSGLRHLRPPSPAA